MLVNGGNANQPAPTLTAADSFAGTTMVEGLLSGFAPNTTYTVEFFASAAGDPSTPGQAHVFLGSRTFTTDGSGLALISATLSATVPVGQVITATATSPANNTSQFAIGVIVASPFVVTNTNNSGIGSLRQAILNANAKPGSDTIVFDIPGSGVQTISPASPLPTITETATIDGTTQPGFAGTPIIELDGTGAGAATNGLTLSASDIVVRGLVINRFGGVGIQANSSQNLIEGDFLGTDPTGTMGRGNTLDGIRLNDASSNHIIGNLISANGIDQDAAGINLEANDSNNTIAGNKIGTDVSGNRALGNSLHGIFVGSGSSNNMIGGPTYNDRNVISGNGRFPVADLATQGGVGVYIFGTGTSGNVVQGNFIGTNADGTAALVNSIIGVLINQSSGNTVQSNVISGNQLIGVEIAGGTASGNLVQSNKIGTNFDGTTAIPNKQDGIFINNAPNNTILDNLISGNGSVGVQLFGPLTSGNVIQGNMIGLDAAGRPTLPNPAGGIFVDTNPFANQLGGAGPGQANQGQDRVVLGLFGLSDPGPTSSVAARRQSRRGKVTPTRTRAVAPSSHPSGPSAHVHHHWSPSGGKKRSPHRV